MCEAIAEKKEDLNSKLCRLVSRCSYSLGFREYYLIAIRSLASLMFEKETVRPSQTIFIHHGELYHLVVTSVKSGLTTMAFFQSVIPSRVNSRDAISGFLFSKRF